MPGAFLGTGDRKMNTTDKLVPSMRNDFFPWIEENNKYIRKYLLLLLQSI